MHTQHIGPVTQVKNTAGETLSAANALMGWAFSGHASRRKGFGFAMVTMRERGQERKERGRREENMYLCCSIHHHL